MPGLNEMQEKDDQDLIDGTIGHGQWRNRRKLRGGMYAAFLFSAGVRFPDSAQALEPEDWQKYLKDVYTMSGHLTDRRRSGEILLAGLNSIPVPTIHNTEEEDWEEWYRLRDSYIDGLSEKQRDILEEEREISMTPIEKEYHEDFNVLHEYFNIVEDELANQKELLSLYREWRKLSRTQDADTVREFTDKHPVEFRIIFSIRDKGKDNKRKTNCNIDLVLRKWDITQTYKCPDNIILEKRQQLSVTATP
jgi:hypothetical protein